MICTVTLNPSLDYIVAVDGFALGMTNRTTAEELMPGGKGINVSILLQNLGLENTALGFVAGFTGDEILRRLEAMGIHGGFIRLEQGFSRINLKLSSIEGTEINGQGPSIPADKLAGLMARLAQLGQGDLLFLSGSVPASMPEDIYQQIMAMLEGRGVQVVVDATRQQLLRVLPYRPFLIKPNHHELGELFGVALATREQVIPYAQKLREQGARNVLVSMAGEGAVLAAEDGSVHAAPAPKGRLVNGVGAGDSMVAGFMAGWLQRQDYGHAFRMGVAAGSASAFTQHLATREQVEAVYRQLAQSRPGAL